MTVCCTGTKISITQEHYFQLSLLRPGSVFPRGLQHNKIQEIRADTFVQLMALRSMQVLPARGAAGEGAL